MIKFQKFINIPKVQEKHKKKFQHVSEAVTHLLSCVTKVLSVDETAGLYVRTHKRSHL